MIDAVAAAPRLGSDKFPDNAGKMPLVVLRAGDRPGHRFAQHGSGIDGLLLGNHLEAKAERLRQAFAAIELLENEGVRAERRLHIEPIIHLSPAIMLGCVWPR